MPADPVRLRRLQRLERVRAIARQALALEAAEAEGTLVRLEALAKRTRRLAEDYHARGGADSGHELGRLARFVAGLQRLTATAEGDAAHARLQADYKQQELAMAERRRVAAEDRAARAARDLAALRAVPVLGARRTIGTGLE